MNVSKALSVMFLVVGAGVIAFALYSGDAAFAGCGGAIAAASVALFTSRKSSCSRACSACRRSPEPAIDPS